MSMVSCVEPLADSQMLPPQDVTLKTSGDNGLRIFLQEQNDAGAKSGWG